MLFFFGLQISKGKGKEKGSR